MRKGIVIQLSLLAPAGFLAALFANLAIAAEPIPCPVAAEPEAHLEIPFIGKIRTRMRSENVVVTIEDQRSTTLEFTVFTDERGQFLRASYRKAGSTDSEDTAKAVQEGMKARMQKVVGLAKSPPKIPWQNLLKSFSLGPEVSMEKITQLSITYLEYQLLDEASSPLYLIHVFGATTPSPNIPDRPENRRIRFIADENGRIIRFDNCL